MVAACTFLELCLALSVEFAPVSLHFIVYFPNHFDRFRIVFIEATFRLNSKTSDGETFRPDVYI